MPIKITVNWDEYAKIASITEAQFMFAVISDAEPTIRKLYKRAKKLGEELPYRSGIALLLGSPGDSWFKVEEDQ